MKYIKICTIQKFPAIRYLHPMFITKKRLLYREQGLFSLLFHRLSKHTRGEHRTPPTVAEPSFAMARLTLQKRGSYLVGSSGRKPRIAKSLF